MPRWAMTVSARIRDLRSALELTQADLAERSGTLRRTEINKLETGKLKAGSYRAVSGLAKAFDLDVVICHAYLTGDLTIEQVIRLRRGGH